MKTLILMLITIFSFQSLAVDLYFGDSDDENKEELAGKIIEVSPYINLSQRSFDPNPLQIKADSGKTCIVFPKIAEKNGLTFEDIKKFVEYDENGKITAKTKFYLVCIPSKKDNRLAIGLRFSEYEVEQ